MPEGSNPKREEQFIGHEQISVGDVVGLMRLFQRMDEALINRLDRYEDRALTPLEGPPHTPAGTGRVY
jgi:hypothetical protein